MIAVLGFLIVGVISAGFFLYRAINAAVLFLGVFAITVAVSIVPDALRDSFLGDVIGPNTSVLWVGWLFFLVLSYVWLEELGLLVSAALAGVLFMLWLFFDFDVSLAVLAIALYVATPGVIKRIFIALVAPAHDRVGGCIFYGIAFLAISAPIVSFCMNGLNHQRDFEFATLIISGGISVWYVFVLMRVNKII